MFNLQMFGENDTVTSSEELKVNAEFGANDTRLITLKNPRENLTGTDISNAFSDVSITKVIVGDKDDADFTGLKEAYKIQKSDYNLDLS